MAEKIINRCMGCHAIEIAGEILQAIEYDETILERLGYRFSHGYLSEECVRNAYPEYYTKGNARESCRT